MNVCPPIVRAALSAVACVNACAQTLPGGDPAGLGRPVFVLRGIATPAPLQRFAQTPLPGNSMPDAQPSAPPATRALAGQSIGHRNARRVCDRAHRTPMFGT
ncbi:hypothetical protein WL05_24070 [Burkholderia ubonensis]|uniref:hypothetical protein n=1 Tax=Burkholderia ubonensis TaxID=101571 RepID=UPI000755D059|nr:hypothetical protein [Burkholderia ubonensis]KVM10875.1 hypothetical protein WJ51_17880 [Burkholderia ubonensis]KVM12392.1 hypothetical protein WJ52_20350 [Burkholderia ubonensis]KVM46917.1 hypothetical protein WJ56_22525 [Burkholderia ubonensis]KVO91827.1 hypothetical protein WJ80_02785 [Burkholderia ubonensis]KVR31389.1 hypothetical protein WK14_01850 [Burkholderia ubonensis]